MFDFIMVPAIMAVIGATIYGIFELFARRKERLAIIEKMCHFQSQTEFNLPAPLDYIPLNFLATNKRSFISLRFGMLFTGLGLGVLIGYFVSADVNFNMNLGRYRDQIELIVGAFVLFFGGAFLCIASAIEYIITNIDNRKNK